MKEEIETTDTNIQKNEQKQTTINGEQVKEQQIRKNKKGRREKKINIYIYILIYTYILRRTLREQQS